MFPLDKPFPGMPQKILVKNPSHVYLRKAITLYRFICINNQRYLAHINQYILFIQSFMGTTCGRDQPTTVKLPNLEMEPVEYN